MPTTRAILVDDNAPGRLSVSSIEAPVPAAGEAVVRVHAISLNRGEVRMAQGAKPGARLGWDIAGVVEQPAADGSGPKVGDRVVGMLRTGAWLEHLPIATPNLAVLPGNVSFSDASTLPVAGLTAVYALERAENLLGANVLVTGASGGVGHLAIQLAKHAGARVTGLVRQEKHLDVVREAGADVAVADETGEAARADGPYDHILDSVGGELLTNVITMLGMGGHMVNYGVSGGGSSAMDGAMLYRNRQTFSGLMVFYEMNRRTAGAGLSQLARLVSEGRLKPHVAIEAPWTDVGSVAQQLIDRSFPGKAVLLVS